MLLLLGHLHRFLDASGLAAATFLRDVFLLVLRLVSLAILWFAVPVVGCALLACRWLCSSACCWLCSFGSFHHSPDLRCSSRAVLVPLLIYFILLATSSVAVGSVSDSHHWLFGCGSVCASSSESLCGSLRLRGSFWLLPTPQRSIAPLRGRWFAVNAPDPRENSLQQRVLLSVRSGLKSALFMLLAGGLQYHCVMLWAVPPSQRGLSSRPPVTAWSFGSSNTAGCSSILVFSLTENSFVTFARYFPSRVLMTFSLSVTHAGVSTL